MSLLAIGGVLRYVLLKERELSEEIFFVTSHCLFCLNTELTN